MASREKMEKHLRAARARLLSTAGKGLTRTARATRDGVHGVSQAVKSRQTKISDVTADLTAQGGDAVSAAGEAIASAGKKAGYRLDQGGSASDSKGARTAREIGALAARGVGVGGGVIASGGKLVKKTSSLAGGVIGGGIAGSFDFISSTVDSLTITESEIEALQKRLEEASSRKKEAIDAHEAKIRRAVALDQRNELIDLLVVGGVTLAEIVDGASKTPENIEKAFELAYPGLSGAGETFADVVERLPSEDLVGLANGVKGKLFELELVNDLNDGGLDEGYRAEMAESATQSGYDIQIFNSDGEIVQELQAKATESIGYVREALERYPGVDVITTSEVHAQLLALGVAERITDSGISEEVLRQKVEDAIASGNEIDVTDVLPSTLGLAVIALSTILDRSLTTEEKAMEFGDRTAKAGGAVIFAKGALVISNTWWLGLVAGVGSRFLVGKGKEKRTRYEMLKEAVATIEGAPA